MNKGKKLKVVKKIREKEEWDGTVSDIKAFRATTEEMLERKLTHISKYHPIHFDSQNIETDKKESVYDRLTKTRYGNKLKTNDLNQRKEILRDMFIPDKELFQLFSQSEKALSSVEDMFGDHKKRYRVTPSVTLAPERNILPPNSNNSNACALNDFSNSEDENLSSKTDNCNVDNDDDLAKFRKFIEKEKKINDTLQNKLEEKKSVLIESVKKFDVTTETEIVLEKSVILQYICSRLENRVSDRLTIAEEDRLSVDRIMDHFEEVDCQRREEISSLRSDLSGSKELIDALTLELINNGQQMKRMKAESDLFMNSVAMELSQMKSYVIKYFDQRETAVTPSPLVTSRKQDPPYSNLADQLFKENFNFTNTNIHQQKHESSLPDQFRQLQIDQQQTQKRLQKLMTMQKSLSQMPGDID